MVRTFIGLRAAERRLPGDQSQATFGLNAEERGGVASNNKPSFTILDAGSQLTRAGLSWAGALGQATTVTFAFRSTGGVLPEDVAGFSRFTATQIQATLLALQAWSDVASITFQRVSDVAGGYSDNAAILFGNYSSGADGAAAFASLPGSVASASEAGDVWVNSSLSYNAAPTYLNYGQHALVHEIGHAIGLLHPGDYNADPNVAITYSNYAEYYEDSRQYSVMSYFAESNTGASFGAGVYASSVMMDDIAAAQRLYGANMFTRTGDTVYGFNSTADRIWFTATVGGAAPVFCVWDAGGFDTFDFSGYNTGQVIDLRQGSFSNVGGRNGNVSIALGATIENAIGGSGADTIIGNGLDNRLAAGAGNNSIDGGVGSDTAVFTGARSTYTIVWNGNVGTISNGNSSTTVRNVEWLEFSDVTIAAQPIGGMDVTGDLTANVIDGSEFGDIISGAGGDDVLNGAGGADILRGGTGSDTVNGGDGNDYIYADQGDDGIDGGLGSDTVDYFTVPGGVTVNLNLGFASGAFGIDQVSGIERIIGSRGTDLLIGDTNNNYISGGGEGGLDVIYGGAGDDELIGSFSETGGAPDVIKSASVANGGPSEALYLDGAFDLVLRDGIVNTGRAHATVLATSHGGLEYYSFSAAAGRSITVDIDGASFDSTIRILDSAGNVLASNDDGLEPGERGPSTDSYLSFTAPANGVYFVQVGRWVSNTAQGFTAAGAPTGSTYTLHIAVEGHFAQPSFMGGASLYGEDGNDILRSGIGRDVMDGGAGNDQIFAGGGNDLISGGAGDDYISGDGGFDVIDGGEGHDIINYHSVRIVADMATGTVVKENSSTDTIAGIEEIQGSYGDDRISGDDRDNVLYGDMGNDRLVGRAGRDELSGGANDDILEGGQDDDTLRGDNGNDVLIGGSGDDSINGGYGYDIAGYSGVRRAYVASATSVSGNGEGVDSLTGIEDLAFTDGRLTFARDGQAAQVMRLYDAAFNRAPDQSGFEALLDTLENGSLTLQQLANEFIASTEFQSQYAGLTNQQFVEQLYQFCLNRAGDSGGIATWTAALNGGMSRGEVLLAFSESGEHKDLLQGQLDQGLWVADEQTLQIARLYDATYDRLPDQGGLATWRNALGGGMSLIAIAQAFATAPEFQARYGSLSNQAFVELMYQLCLNRNGDAQGIQTWTNALNGGMSRGEVLYNFSESSEHVALTRSTWLGGVPCTDVAAPAPVLPEDKHAGDDGAQVIPVSADPGADASHAGKDGGAQILPGAETAHDGKDAGSDDGAQVVPVVADGAETGGKDAGPQVLPGAADDEAPVAGKDTAPLILPGVIDSVIDDGFLLAKADGDTGPQILPGAADDGADFLFDIGGDAVDAGHDLPGLEHRLAMLFIETGEHAPGLDTGADNGPLDLHHNPDPWAA